MWELEQTCSAQDFCLYESDPWGPVRSDLAAGLIASTLANVNRGRDTQPFSALDFAPFVKPHEPETEPTSADFVKMFG